MHASNILNTKKKKKINFRGYPDNDNSNTESFICYMNFKHIRGSRSNYTKQG